MFLGHSEKEPYPDRNARGWTNFYSKISLGELIFLHEKLSSGLFFTADHFYVTDLTMADSSLFTRTAEPVVKGRRRIHRSSSFRG